MNGVEQLCAGLSQDNIEVSSWWSFWNH